MLTALTAILTIAAIVGNMIANQYATTLNVALNASTYKIIKGDTTEDTEYFKAGFASDEEREAYEAELCATVEAEGAALPLAGSAKVSLFGHGSVDLMYGGTGSGSVDTSKAPNLKEALEAQGIQVNQTLWDLYKSDSMMKNYSRITPASISDTLEANTQYAVNEAPWSALSSAESSFAEYGDAAIVVFSRSGGEGADLPSGANGTNDSWISGSEGSGNYLELSAEEIELLKNLKALKDNGTFKSIVVLINSSNALEMDFLNPAICGEDYGINMHRTAYSGRNFEYYAEDPFVAGTICAAEVQGIQSKGVYVYLKHVALNDSETSRRGVNTWLNEQTAREIYLEVADKAITDGGAWCVMTGFNRWGATWCGTNANLLNGFLREELGMRGMCITDFSGSSQYMDLVDGLIAGSDIWDSPMPKIHTTKAANYENDACIVTQMRNAMHHILYTVVNSNAMNGWSASDTLKTVTPWWQTAIYALIAVLAVLTVLCAWQLSKAFKRKKELADTAPAVDQK